MRLLSLLLLAGCDVVVGLKAPTDAPPDSNFNPADCPAGYVVVGNQSSRYFFVGDVANFTAQRTTCRNMDPARTHLVVLDAPFELQDVYNFLASSQFLDGNFFYVGAVQSATASVVDGEWFWISKMPVDPIVWGPGEPQDFDNTEAHKEDVAALRKKGSTGLYDLSDDARAICECDGMPEPP